MLGMYPYRGSCSQDTEEMRVGETLVKTRETPLVLDKASFA